MNGEWNLDNTDNLPYQPKQWPKNIDKIEWSRYEVQKILDEEIIVEIKVLLKTLNKNTATKIITLINTLSTIDWVQSLILWIQANEFKLSPNPKWDEEIISQIQKTLAEKIGVIQSNQK